MNLKDITEKLGIRPSKKFGQNFLLHENTSKKIIQWANIPKNENVLEIGPGLGAMTFLLAQNHPLYLIEKDHKLAQYLRENIPTSVTLFDADVLEFPLAEIFPGQHFHVISNAPYSISTPIIEKLLTEIHRIKSMTFLFQEEVVDRICAETGTKNYGRLAIWIQSQCDIERGPRISRENFFPKPDVESRLVRVSPSANPIVPKEDSVLFLAWIGKIFQQRRKTLRKILKGLTVGHNVINLSFEKIGLSETVRAESLEIEKLYLLFKHVSR